MKRTIKRTVKTIQKTAINFLPPWTTITPIIGIILLTMSVGGLSPLLIALFSVVLFLCVLASVHHAEVIAHKVGEPYGTFILALAVTVIETSLIVSTMLANPEGTITLLRDTVYSAIMILMSGVLGVCLWLGAHKHFEQEFNLNGVKSALSALITVSIFTVILPNFTKSSEGPTYSALQLGFIGSSILVIYLAFIFFQTIKHRDYFLPVEGDISSDDQHANKPTARTTLFSGVLLVIALIAVVLLAKKIAPYLESFLVEKGAPKAFMGIVIATVVLLPEAVAAVRAASVNRIQTSLNLAVGSALATIGLTVPLVTLLSFVFGWQLQLGLESKDMMLVMMTYMVSMLSLSSQKTNVLQGFVHIIIFIVYIVIALVP